MNCTVIKQIWLSLLILSGGNWLGRTQWWSHDPRVLQSSQIHVNWQASNFNHMTVAAVSARTVSHLWWLPRALVRMMGKIRLQGHLTETVGSIGLSFVSSRVHVWSRTGYYEATHKKAALPLLIRCTYQCLFISAFGAWGLSETTIHNPSIHELSWFTTLDSLRLCCRHCALIP